MANQSSQGKQKSKPDELEHMIKTIFFYLLETGKARGNTEIVDRAMTYLRTGEIPN